MNECCYYSSAVLFKGLLVSHVVFFVYIKEFRYYIYTKAVKRKAAKGGLREFQ